MLEGVSERLSSLFFRTLKEDPADAEVASHKLLYRAGYIRRQAPGIFAWMPLGLRVLRKIEDIIREEMNAAGAQEVHFPALLPAEPYKATNRWTEYGDEMFRLKDRKETDYLLAPTHEEAFTLLVKDIVSSYKDLPLNLYQIQTKYRDEARPRAGLLRGREFIMKDAYSFDVADAGLATSYQVMRDAYERIFQRLHVPYVIVNAVSGPMGGSRSEEFLSPSAIGEDTYVSTAGGYAANVEAVTTPVPVSPDSANVPLPEVIPSPNTPTIATLVDLVNTHHPKADGATWTAADTLKNVVLRITYADHSHEILVVGLPGNRDVDLKRVEASLGADDVVAASADDLQAFPQLVAGYIGPWSATGQLLGTTHGSAGIRYLVDPRVVDGTVWVTGANLRDQHALNVVAGRDFVADGTIEAAEVREGDPAPDGSGPLRAERGIEIGHVFQLGRKYTEALDLNVLDEHGKLVTPTMGSYGIGVTRVLAVLAENNHDDRGLIWPKHVAPFQVHLVATGRDDAVFEAAESAYGALTDAGVDVLFDDRRKVSPGVKFGDAELLGMPYVVVFGRGVAHGEVEFWDRREGTRTVIPITDAVEQVTRVVQ